MPLQIRHLDLEIIKANAMLEAQNDGIPRHGPIMYAVRTVFRECRVFGRSDVWVNTHGRVYAAISVLGH